MKVSNWHIPYGFEAHEAPDLGMYETIGRRYARGESHNFSTLQLKKKWSKVRTLFLALYENL